MAIKLSQVSKLDGIPSWSLTAGRTCPGSKGEDGELVDACKGCYAWPTRGNYRFTSSRAVRAFNELDWKRPGWVADMVAALDDHRYFRWFDSGDVYALPLAEKILLVMQRTPGTKHWLPTRMHKFEKFERVFKRMEALPNVVVRRSSDAIDGSFTPGVHGSTIVPPGEPVARGVHACQAYEHDGKCSGCRACWDKEVKVVAYQAHGAAMRRLLAA